MKLKEPTHEKKTIITKDLEIYKGVKPTYLFMCKNKYMKEKAKIAKATQLQLHNDLNKIKNVPNLVKVDSSQLKTKSNSIVSNQSNTNTNHLSRNITKNGNLSKQVTRVPNTSYMNLKKPEARPIKSNNFFDDLAWNTIIHTMSSSLEKSGKKHHEHK